MADLSENSVYGAIAASRRRITTNQLTRVPRTSWRFRKNSKKIDPTFLNGRMAAFWPWGCPKWPPTDHAQMSDFVAFYVFVFTEASRRRISTNQLTRVLKTFQRFQKNTKKVDLTFLHCCNSEFWLRGRPKPQLLLEKKYRKSSIWRYGKKMVGSVFRMTFLMVNSSSVKPSEYLSKLV